MITVCVRACNELGLNACYLLEMYILPVLGSGVDADNGMVHLVTFIHSFVCVRKGGGWQRMCKKSRHAANMKAGGRVVPASVMMHGVWDDGICTSLYIRKIDMQGI
jgi:hypothetical protein